MAADLVQNPAIIQTYQHDLESALWVMLWVVQLYMKTSWTGDSGIGATRTSFIKDTMSPNSYGSGGGSITKTSYMKSPDLEFVVEKNPTLSEFLEALKRFLRARYFQDKKGGKGIYDKVVPRDPHITVPEDSEGYYAMAFEIFKMALNEVWPYDDTPSRQDILLSRRETHQRRSSSKRTTDDTLGLPSSKRSSRSSRSR